MPVKNLNTREKYLLAATVSLAVVAAVYSFLLEPFVGHWRQINDEVEDKVNIVKKNLRIMARYNDLKEEYSRLSEYMKSETADEEEEASILKEIESISTKASVFILNIKPYPVKDLGNYKLISFDLTAEADIRQFSKFAYDIEMSSKLLKVKSFTIFTKSRQSDILKGIFLITKIVMK